MILIRTGDVVTDSFGRELAINRQASKGPGNEVVNIHGLEGSNGRHWIALKKIAEGTNDLDLIEPPKKTQAGGKVISGWSFNKTEEAEFNKLNEQMKELQEKINGLKRQAIERYNSRPNLDIDVTTMTEEEKSAHIEKLLSYYKDNFGIELSSK